MKTSRLSAYDKSQLNEAISKERYANAFYLNLSNRMQANGWFGCQKYFKNEAEDEMKHYQIVADFMNDRGDCADIPMIPAIEFYPIGLMDTFTASLEIEEELGEFYETYYKETDCQYVKQRLLELIQIQRESISKYMDHISILNNCDNDPSALLLFDTNVNN